MATKRFEYIDLLRCIACILVVVMHSPMPGIGTTGMVLSSVSLFTAPGVPLFFMLSGALLLPTSLSMGDFMKRRLGRVFWPTLLWTFFYIGLSIFTGRLEGKAILKSVFSIPFSPQGHGVLWFMYAIMGLYFITPIISPWLQRASRREVELVLIAWAITLCYPILKIWLTVSDGAEGMLYYFSGYVGYYLLGYYLHRWRPRISLPVIALLFVVPFGAAIGCKVTHVEVDFYSVFWYLSIFVAMMAVAWFSLVMRYVPLDVSPTSRFWKTVNSLSRFSFDIYLMHIFVMRTLLWRYLPLEQWGGDSDYPYQHPHPAHLLDSEFRLG